MLADLGTAGVCSGTVLSHATVMLQLDIISPAPLEQLSLKGSFGVFQPGLYFPVSCLMKTTGFEIGSLLSESAAAGSCGRCALSIYVH